MKLAKLLQSFAIICVFSNLLSAQTDPTLEIGFKPYGSYHGGDLDSVSLTNGNLTVHIPVAGYPQRGSFGYSPRITYNNKGWYVVPNCNSITGVCSPYWAWHGAGVNLDMSSEDTFGVSYQRAFPGSLMYAFSAGTSDGSVHQLASNQAGGMSTLDGSGLWYDGTSSSNLQPGLARNRWGSSINGNSGPFKDANGNLLTEASSPLTDTLGRSFPMVWSPTTDLSGCTGPLPIAFAGTYTLPGFNSVNRIIKVCEATVSLQSNFQASGYYNSTLYDITERSYHSDQIQSIVLYNGVSWANSPAWTFEYSSRNAGDAASVNYGDLTKITLPTGGSISYTWNTMESCDPNAVTPESRRVESRTVDANDGTGPHTWTYNGVVTDPDGNDTLHIFTALNNSCSWYETQTKYFKGSSQSGTLLKTVNTDYQWIANPFDTVNPSNTLRTVTNVFPIRITTTWPNGQVTKVEKDYDSNLVFGVPGHSWTTASYGNVVEVREYDYGNGAPGALLRRTDYTYRAFDGSPSASSYLAANLIGLVSSVTVYDGVSNQVSKITYGYDESALQASGVSPQLHDASLANPGVRGNRTSEGHWLNTTGTTLTSTFTYYDTGTPYQATDPGGHVTTNFYGPGFQSLSDFAGAYPTQVQNALQQNTYFDYDFNTGLRTAVKDANSQISTWDYDIFNRTLHAYAPDGGKTTWNYTDSQPPTFTVTSPITSTMNHVGEGDLDGLGRISHSKLLSDPQGTDTVDTTYDGRGEVLTVSNPHRTAAGATDGITTTMHDALGRATQITKQDGSISKMVYNVATSIQVNGDCNIAIDEAGKQRGACSDALGRLVEVDEPSGVPVQVNYRATLLTDGNFVLENAAGTGVWSTGTYGTNASSIYMQDDGNLVLYVFKWSAGTYATPSPGPFPTQGCSIGTSYLMVNQRLNAYQCIVSPHGQYELYMGSDGNFYIYDIAHNVGTWGPGTYGHPGAYAIMQGDGNLCVYDANNVYLWCSGTGGTNADRLNMEDDGRIIIYKSAWNSGTGGQPYGTAMAHPGCDVGNSGLGQTGILGSGTCLVSPNGRFELLMQGDGNLVIYDLGVSPAHALWSTNTTILPTDPAVAMRTLYSYDTLGNLLRVDQQGTAPNDSTQWRTRTFKYDSLSRLLSATNPESGTISYTYDADGNMITKTDARGIMISYIYDPLHRLVTKTYSDGSPSSQYHYDNVAWYTSTNSIGRLVEIYNGASDSAYFSYDAMGRVVSHTRYWLNGGATVSASYDLAGGLAQLTYPNGEVVKYTPDSAGRIVSAVDSGNGINFVTGATYGPDNSLTGFVSGSGGPTAITNNFSYNRRLQPLSMSASSPTQTLFSIGYDFHLGAGDNGNVWGITNYKDTTRNQAFTYDVLNRLTSAQNAGTNCAATTVNGKTEYWGNSYGYDAWGNLLQKSVTKCSAENLSVAALANNRLSGYSYDAAGNMTNDGLGHAYTFDAENRIAQVNSGAVNYVYDADGNRVRKDVSGQASTEYFYFGGDIIAESNSTSGWTNYVFFGGERVARKDSTGVFYYFSDHLKTASVITDSLGNIKSESDFYPWGGELQFVANDSNHYKFTGKERDGESGLDNYGARYYSNGLGRWVSADWSPTPVPVPYAEFSNPQSLNLYGFVGGNPASKADPDGHCWPLGQCAHIAMDSVNKAAASLDETAKNLKSPALAATLSFTSGATRDVVNGVVGLGTVGEASGTVWDSGNTTQRGLAAVEDGGKVGGIILTVVAIAGPKAPASADSGAQVAGDIGKNRVTLGNGSQVDLAGKTHFEKSTGASVPTPHIKDPVYNTNPNTGQTFQNGYGATRGATVGDVNAAATAAGAKPPVTIPTPLPVPVPQKEQ